ncbi:MAG: DNA primase, partial [Blautia sp.]|nr:DNA primase [Blautia sp.]
MNRKIFENYMHTEPDTLDKKYMFIVDNIDLALSIIDAGFSVVVLQEDGEAFFSPDGLMEYLNSIAFRGTCRMDYMYVPACSTKKTNDTLAEFLREEALDYREGWMLFKDKDYLQKLSHRTEMQKLLHSFIERYEKPPEAEPDLDRFHILDKNGNPTNAFDIAIVEEILETVPFFVLRGIPYVYDHGVYREDPDGCRLKRVIQNHLYRKLKKIGPIGRIYALLIIQPEAQKYLYELYNMPAHWINFRNGYYDPIENVMIEHDPKYLSMNQVPHEYHPEDKISALAGGEAIRKYLDTSLPDPQEQQMFWEYAGYCMTTDTQMQKFLMLTGNGGTGKSILIDLVQKLVGIENCSNIPIQDLNHRFYATGMFGKLLNACGDIPCKAMTSTDVVKKSVGEDAIVFEKKGKDATHFFSRAKLL